MTGINTKDTEKRANEMGKDDKFEVMDLCMKVNDSMEGEQDRVL